MMNGSRRVKRLIAGGAVGLLGLTLAPTADAAISTTAFGANVPTGQSGFTDIAQAGVHQRNVELVKASGVASGTTATTYAPQQQTTRDQMASFVANLIDVANTLDAPGGTTIPDLPTAAASPNAFTDDTGNTHEANINRLAAADIVNGTGGTNYSPANPVRRDQMATFIAAALGFIRGGALPVGTDAFTDDNGNTHEANINRLANADIVDGKAAAKIYDVAGIVSRAQMGSFTMQGAADLHADAFINPIPSATNQAFTVAGADQAIAFGAANARTCTVTAPSGTVVDLVLVPSEDVTTSGGTTLLADPDQGETYNSGALPAPAVEPEIVSVNGAPQNADFVLNVTSGGTITVAIAETGAGAADDVRLLAFSDASGGTTDFLDLTNATPNNANPKAPSEQFGVGCRTFTIPAEAALGNQIGQTSDLVNRDLDYFVDNTPGQTFFWDSNDTFQFSGIGITQAQFEGALSSGAAFDTLTVTYNPDAAGVSTFNVTTDFVGAPSAVTATVVNLDAGGTINDVRVVFTPNANNGPDTVFDIVADNVTNDQLITPTETVLGNNVACTVAADGTCTLTFNNAPNGTYDILVRAENPATTQVSLVADSADITVPGAADAVAPLAIDTLLTTSGGLAGDLDTGDTFKVVFNEAMAAPGAGDRFRVTDTNGTPSVGDVTCGTNATCTANAVAEVVNEASRAANTVITVVLTGDPTVVTAGSTAGIQLNATISDQAGNTDTAANLWLAGAGGQDTLIETDAADLIADSTDATLPTVTSAVATDGGLGNDVLTLTMSEPVRCNGLDDGQFSYDADGAGAGVAVAATVLTCNGSTTVTVEVPTGTFGALPDADDTFNYTQSGTAANRVRDLSENLLANIVNAAVS